MGWAASLQSSLMQSAGVKCTVGEGTTEYGTVWTTPDVSRTRRHLTEGEWDVPAYIVVFPYDVIDDPEFRNGAEVRNVVTGEKGTIRFMNDAVTENNHFSKTVIILMVDR